MPGDLIVLNGPAGVGKTTVARRLAELQPGTVHIVGDTLRSFSPTDARHFLGAGSTYRAGANLAANYLEMGAPRVIFDYVFETSRSIDHFRGPLPADLPCHVITLWAPLETVSARESGRPDSPPLGSRVARCHATMARELPGLGWVLDTSRITAEEVARAIHDRLAAGGGPEVLRS